ncbi:MAG TPA: hypothetical protein EYH39_02660, partial [Desulfurobacteriaceae bacterium]|nr:hypothetical protein [Desulfurobacteriaceae bacterium]
MGKKEKKVKLSDLAKELGYENTKNLIEDIKNLKAEDERIENLKNKRLTVRSSVDFRTAVALKDYILSQRQEEEILMKHEVEKQKITEIKQKEEEKKFEEVSSQKSEVSDLKL